jgi:haloacetate dehalogenase
MAQDQVEIMSALGHERFALFGHDRGGRVACRLTLDHPERVSKLAVLDIVPAHYLYTNVTREFVEAYIHWFMFIRPAPFAENIIANTGMFAGGGPGEVGEYYRSVYRDPAAIHAMCEDYRASANMDLEIDKADLDAGKKIASPLNVLWGGERRHGQDVRCAGNLADGGHRRPRQGDARRALLPQRVSRGNLRRTEDFPGELITAMRRNRSSEG